MPTVPRLRTRTPWEEVLEPARGDQLVRTARQGGKAAETAPVPDSLHPELGAALAAAGVDLFF